MSDVESLKRIKSAEDDVRTAREKAEAESMRIVRDARAEAEKIVEGAKAHAEHEAAQMITAARGEALQDRTRLVAAGKKAADAVMERTGTKAFERSVELLVERFEARLKE
ncbi:MAG: hypothetical protein HY556_05600 [Euryarchaeota archaeon]|nr:hypothetical protein [Euryarchaeota archaeon]